MQAAIQMKEIRITQQEEGILKEALFCARYLLDFIFDIRLLTMSSCLLLSLLSLLLLLFNWYSFELTPVFTQIKKPMKKFPAYQ